MAAQRVVLVGVFAAMLAVSTSAYARTNGKDCTPPQVRLSASRIDNAFTGGSYPAFVTLRNVSNRACSIEGRPLVVVTPHSFPVIVGDLAAFDRNLSLNGPERVLDVLPGRSVRAYIVIDRRCDGARNEMTSGSITFSANGRNASIDIRACRREGVQIDTGPFLPKR